MNRKEFLIANLLALVLLTVAFASKSTSQPVRTFDPWADYDDNGAINIIDIAAIAALFGTSGDPAKKVNVTDLPTVTGNNYLTTVLNESEDGVFIMPQILSASLLRIGIGGKSVTFLGGGVSGGITWSSWDVEYGNNAGGGCPGSGRVEVYGSTGTLLAQFALPLHSMLTVQDVDQIRLYAEAPVPTLASLGPSLSSYSVFVAASVYWREG